MKSKKCRLSKMAARNLAAARFNDMALQAIEACPIFFRSYSVEWQFRPIAFCSWVLGRLGWTCSWCLNAGIGFPLESNASWHGATKVGRFGSCLKHDFGRRGFRRWDFECLRLAIERSSVDFQGVGVRARQRHSLCTRLARLGAHSCEFRTQRRRRYLQGVWEQGLSSTVVLRSACMRKLLQCH
jgi:hypothetical protein